MENAKIREARREELAQIVTLYNLMWTDSDTPIDTKVGENIFDQMQGDRQWMYVVDLDGRVVASFMVLIGGADGSECILDNVVVHPRYQRKGIGRKMLAFVTEKCLEMGCRQIVVSKRERDRGSKGFYESLGFERTSVGFVRRLD